MDGWMDGSGRARVGLHMVRESVCAFDLLAFSIDALRRLCWAGACGVSVSVPMSVPVCSAF